MLINVIYVRQSGSWCSGAGAAASKVRWKMCRFFSVACSTLSKNSGKLKLSMWARGRRYTSHEIPINLSSNICPSNMPWPSYCSCRRAFVFITYYATINTYRDTILLYIVCYVLHVYSIRYARTMIRWWSVCRYFARKCVYIFFGRILCHLRATWFLL